MAGAKMGAGILECDVAFTVDRGLVCRHSLCDLHTTTNILLHPDLAVKCTVPSTPSNATSPANAIFCTSDITTDEYLTLCGKQDGHLRDLDVWRMQLRIRSITIIKLRRLFTTTGSCTRCWITCSSRLASRLFFRIGRVQFRTTLIVLGLSIIPIELHNLVVFYSNLK